MVHIYELSIPILLTVWLAKFSTSTAILGGAVSVGYGLFGAGALPGGLLVEFDPRVATDDTETARRSPRSSIPPGISTSGCCSSGSAARPSAVA